MISNLRRIYRTLSPRTFPRGLPSSPADLAAHDQFAGLNRQYMRATLILDIIRRFEPRCFVETGTWVGNTSALIAAQTRLPIFSSELNPAHVQAAKRRLRIFGDRIRIFPGDSREFLRNVPAYKPIVYLDAHWNEDLPLREEIEIVVRRWPEAFIIVDDFAVPWDDGYKFDSYPIGTLDTAYVSDLLHKYQLTPFFPAFPAGMESGARRGWVVLAPRRHAGTFAQAYSPNWLRTAG